MNLAHRILVGPIATADSFVPMTSYIDDWPTILQRRRKRMRLYSIKQKRKKNHYDKRERHMERDAYSVGVSVFFRAKPDFLAPQSQRESRVVFRQGDHHILTKKSCRVTKAAETHLQADDFTRHVFELRQRWKTHATAVGLLFYISDEARHHFLSQKAISVLRLDRFLVEITCRVTFLCRVHSTLLHSAV